ncbi:alpha/beta hydrolase [Enterococcus faecalis]|nr:alpha/beta hydrolase [Enterococcus faecalis]
MMYKQYLKNEQMNFQVNRFLEPYYSDIEVQKEVVSICNRINSLESWFNEWNNIANSKYENRDFGLASAYYQLAEFFLKDSDQRETRTYSLFKESFYRSIPNASIEFSKVPYEESFLPVATITHKAANKWLIFHGGFDSYLEELIRLTMTYLTGLDKYNVLMFEGPGQGIPNKNGLAMTHEWEKPISAILDFFRLSNVSLLGMSLGGYLALRAAAKEKRIEKVIAFDTFYSMEDAFLMNAPKETKELVDFTDARMCETIDNLIEKYSKGNVDLTFKINKAKEIFGKSKPSEVLKEMKKYTLCGIEKEINQNVLLLAGENDMYVPTERTPFLVEKLVNSSKIESIIFSNETGGQYHCQVGNKGIAFNEILKFLN